MQGKRKVYANVCRGFVAFVLMLPALWNGGRTALADAWTEQTKEICANESAMVECEGLGGLDDVGVREFSFFNLRPDAGDFEDSYYAQLDEISRKLYTNIYESYKDGPDTETACKTTLDMEFENVTLVWNATRSVYDVNDDKVSGWCRGSIVPAMLALIYDHPEMSWLVNTQYGFTYSYSYERGLAGEQVTANVKVTGLTIQFKDVNVGTKEEMDLAIAGAKKAIAAGDISTNYKKLKAIHDYLTDTISYNHCAASSGGTVNSVSKTYTKKQKDAYQTAYSAFYPCNGDDESFGEGQNYTVCAGYARGFKVLCDAYNIPCIYVTGTGNGEAHGWNYVRINENWYAVDCTWDDRDSDTVYTYFLVGSESEGFSSTFGEEHISSGRWSEDHPYTFFYPPLASVEYCYHADVNRDAVCDVCERIIGVEMSVEQEDWTYGDENPPAPVVTLDNDMEALADCLFLYKEKTAPDSEYDSSEPTEAGEYTIQAVLPHKCDKSYDYPTVKATADFVINKATLEPDAPEPIEVIYKENLKLSDIASMDEDWEWDEPDTEVGSFPVDADGTTKEYPVHYRLPDERNYNPVLEVLSVKYIPCVHQDKKRVETSEVTCTDKGILDMVCEYCGSVISTEEVPSLGHNFTWIEDQKATLYSDGKKHEECRRCHQWGEVVTLPKLKGDTSQKPSQGNETSSENKEQETSGNLADKQEGNETSSGNKGQENSGNPADQKEEQPQTGSQQEPLEAGTELVDGNTGSTFVITNPGKMADGRVMDAEVQYVKADATKKNIVIKDELVIGGTTYKVTGIAPNAFKNHKKATAVTIGKNVMKIGKNAFSGCKKLKKITIKSSKLKSIGKNAFKGIAKNAVIKVPQKQYQEYKKMLKSSTGFKKTMKIKK